MIESAEGGDTMPAIETNGLTKRYDGGFFGTDVTDAIVAAATDHDATAIVFSPGAATGSCAY